MIFPGSALRGVNRCGRPKQETSCCGDRSDIGCWRSRSCCVISYRATFVGRGIDWLPEHAWLSVERLWNVTNMLRRASQTTIFTILKPASANVFNGDFLFKASGLLFQRNGNANFPHLVWYWVKTPYVPNGAAQHRLQGDTFPQMLIPSCYISSKKIEIRNNFPRSLFIGFFCINAVFFWEITSPF